MANNKIMDDGSDAEDAGDINFQIGDSVVALTHPPTEGLIISRTISDEGRLELTIIVAPHKKRGQSWTHAMIVTRDAARLSKKTLLSFNFPLKNVELLRAEAKKARADPVWAYTTCVALDKNYMDTYFSDDSDLGEKEEKLKKFIGKASASSSAHIEEALETDRQPDNLELRMKEVEQLNNTLHKKETRKDADSSDSDLVAWKKFRKQRKKHKKKKATKKNAKASSSDSSSSSSSSDSDSSKEAGQVREKGKTGMFTCPFHETDDRGYKDIKCQIKGQTTIRKNVRVALHNLYVAHHTLTSFADALISQANSSAFKPFSSDVAWFRAYARNIDGILLGSLSGPWGLWNEQYLDEMVTGFLELLIRVSPNKDYPACLDDGVRKWMRKKRIGANTKYGPVSFAVQHARFTDGGLQLYQSGWQKSREKVHQNPLFPSAHQRDRRQVLRGVIRKPPLPSTKLKSSIEEVHIPPPGECEVCVKQVQKQQAGISWPLLLPEKSIKEGEGRKNRKRRVQKFLILNQRIMGLNILGKGWNMVYEEIKWIHLACAPKSFQLLCRRMMNWKNQLLTVPRSMSAFNKVLKSHATYGSSEIRRLAPSEIMVNAISLPQHSPHILPLLDILPQEEALAYKEEANWIIRDPLIWEEMKKIRVNLGFNMIDYVQVIKKLLDLKMVKLLPSHEVKVINGVQCVTKPDGRQRLIFDGRAVNTILHKPDKIFLPDFSLLADWIVNDIEILRFGKLDIDNFYHRLGVPYWMQKYLGLPKLRAELISKDIGEVCPVCLTLPMGLSHAVFLAQKAHLFLLSRCSFSSLINKSVSNYSKVWVMTYIDDVILGIRDMSSQKAEDQLNLLLDEAIEAYQTYGLIVNTNKIKKATDNIIGLGCCMSNLYKSVSPNPQKISDVISATKLLINCDRASTKAVEILVGHWVWFFLLARPFFAIFFHIYRWLHQEEITEPKTIWLSVKREFTLAILFADRCFLTWRRRNDSFLLASDASLSGAGACELRLPIPPQPQTNWGQLMEQLSAAASWTPILNQRWKRREHINVLELRALVLAISKWLYSPQHQHTRWNIVVDSQVISGAIKKGRSSAYMICCLLRRILAMSRREKRSYRRLTLGLATSTIRQYVTAIQKFQRTAGKIRFSFLDDQILDYIQVIPPLAQRGIIEKLIASFKHFFPEVASKLPRSQRFAKQLQKQYKGLTKPPMIWDVVILLIFKLISLGFPTTALGVYLQFDCYLRPSELCSILSHHIALPGGNILGSQTQKVLILLLVTKTGPLQSVRVNSIYLQQLLIRLVNNIPRATKIFPSYYIYRKRLAYALELLGLTHVGYTPHSIRHGAATMALINQGEQALPGIMFRGRWESAAGKAYLQMGAAALLFAELPDYLIRNAEVLTKELSSAFNNATLIPTV